MTRKTLLQRSTLAALTAALSMSVAYAKDDAVATVNGKAIPKARLEMLVSGQMAQGQPDTPELRNAIREELIRGEVMMQEATKKGFDKKADVLLQVEVARQRVVVGAYLQDYVQKNPITEEQIKAEYDAIKSRLGDKEYKARHILVQTESEANAIIEKLNKGAKFEDLASASLDPGSKERGGDLGWSTPVSYVKSFSDALTQLQRGAYTKSAVKTDFGFHVIMLEDIRALQLPSLDEARPQIGQRLMQQMVEKHLRELRAKASVK